MRSKRQRRAVAAAVGSGTEGVPQVSPPFPSSYESLVNQAQRAVKAAIDDGHLLVEVEFPPGGLETVAGDEEGNNELNATARYLRAICRIFEREGKAESTRVYFPDKTELSIATEGREWSSSDGIRGPENSGIEATFADWPGPVDFLTDPSFVTESGLGRFFGDKKLSGRKLADRTAQSDSCFVCAYPGASLNEMVTVGELYEDTGLETGRPIVVVNGELDRIRTGYYPPFWARTEMQYLKRIVPKFTQAYYIHNFKGSRPSALFRAYPGPWQLYQRDLRTGDMTLLHEQEDFIPLSEAALELIPKLWGRV